MSRLMKLFQWIKNHYMYIGLSSLILGSILGFKTTVPGQVIQNYSAEYTIVMIFLVSLTITPRQLMLIVKKPRVVIIGLFLSFIIMPFLSWFIARIMVSEPHLSAGIILLGLAPTAVNATVWTALLEGDTSISLAITGATMLLSTFLIPPLMLLLNGTNLTINVQTMLQQTITLFLIPMLFGIFLRWFLNKRLNTFLKMIPAITVICSAVLAFGINNINMPLILDQASMIPSLFGAIFVIYPLGFIISYVLIKSLCKPEEIIPLTYASAMKNLVAVLGLSLASFPSLVSFPIAISLIPQIISAGLFFNFIKRQRTKYGLQKTSLMDQQQK